MFKKYFLFCPPASDYQIEKAISWINNQLKKDIFETYFARVGCGNVLDHLNVLDLSINIIYKNPEKLA